MKLAERKLLEASSQAYCSRCKTAQPFAQFTPCQNRRNGLNAVCRKCAAEKSAIQRTKHPETRKNWRNSKREIERAQSRARYQRNPEAGKKASAKWRSENLQKIQRYREEWSAKQETKILWRHWSAKRRALTKQATPNWAEPELIELVYAEAAHRGLVVDHVIPLRGKNVCGLHVHTNMQLLTAHENSRKSNKFSLAA